MEGYSVTKLHAVYGVHIFQRFSLKFTEQRVSAFRSCMRTQLSFWDPSGHRLIWWVTKKSWYELYLLMHRKILVYHSIHHSPYIQLHYLGSWLLHSPYAPYHHKRAGKTETPKHYCPNVQTLWFTSLTVTIFMLMTTQYQFSYLTFGIIFLQCALLSSTFIKCQSWQIHARYQIVGNIILLNHACTTCLVIKLSLFIFYLIGPDVVLFKKNGWAICYFL